MKECKFQRAWSPKCKREADESGYCIEHKGVKCVSCGQQATHSCSETGQFVCGAPLCDDCTHNINPVGTNGGVGFYSRGFPEGEKTHCKKMDLKRAPWYVEKEDVEEYKKAMGIPEENEVELTNQKGGRL